MFCLNLWPLTAEKDLLGQPQHNTGLDPVKNQISESTGWFWLGRMEWGITPSSILILGDSANLKVIDCQISLYEFE